MIKKDYVFEKFLNKKSNQQFVDIYSNKTFAKIYQEMVELDDIPDASFFLKNLNKKGKILEIGSGTGRILHQLVDAGYNAYGIEPSQEMIAQMPKALNDKVLCLGIESIDQALENISNIDVIIIPATTISLFSSEMVNNFLKNLPNNITVYFDYMSEDYFNKNTGLISIYHSQDGGKYFYVNFIHGNKIVYNILNKNTVGVSVKNIYNFNILKTIFNSNGFSLTKEIVEKNGYQMLRGQKYE